MSDWLMRVIKSEAERLIELAAEDNELRADLRALAQAILAATEVPHSEKDPAPAKSPTTPASTAEGGIHDGLEKRDAAPADSDQAVEPLRELTIGRSSPSKSETRSASTAMFRPVTAHDDLIEIETRCRRKGEAARWAAERLRRIREGNGFQVENPPMDRQTVEWADRLTDCFYWMKSAEVSQQADLSVLDDVGGCFEAVAEALALVRVVLEEHPGSQKVWERSLPLVSEAQSALRSAFRHLGAPDDPDQLEVFEWLKATAARHHVYIKSFMRADNLADSTRWSDLIARIESVAASGSLSRRSSSQIQRVRDHLRRLQTDEGNGHDWPAIINAVDEIVGEGVPPSNRELRELLLPVIDKLPERDQLPERFRLVLREIDRFLGTRSSPVRSSVAHDLSAEVKEAARLVGGRSTLLIGGNRRREAQESLKRALELRELIWIETKEHQAINAFEPLIARPDIALVLLAIRWSSHAFGDVKQFCDRHGKPLVRLPGGYSPNQVAAQILSQCSGQLGEHGQNS